MPEFKEPHFFNYLGKSSPHPGKPPWTLDDYAALFAPAGDGRIVGESSASYLYFSEETIRNIREIYGPQYRDVKIVGILRNPIDKAWSYHMLLRRKGHEDDFFTMVDKYCRDEGPKLFHDFIHSGMYSAHVKAYREVFPFVKFVLFDQLRDDPVSVLSEILTFLHVKDTDYVPEDIGTAYNVSGEATGGILKGVQTFLFHDNALKEHLKGLVPYELRQKIKTWAARKSLRRREVPAEIREYLVGIYKPEIERLLPLFPCEEKQSIVRNWLPCQE